MESNPMQPGELLIASQQTNKLSLYNVTNSGSNLLSTLPRIHEKKITHFEFHQQSRLCLSVSEDCVVIWDSLKLKSVKVLRCPQSNKEQTFQYASFNHATHEILTCISDCIYIWDMHTFKLKNILEMPPNTASRHLRFTTFQVSSDKRYLLAGGESHNYIAVWDYQNHSLSKVVALPYGTNGVSKMLVSPRSDNCLILTREGKILLVRLNDFLILFELHASTSYFMSMIVSPDWKLLEAHTDEGLSQVYDLRTVQSHQQKVRHIQAYAAAVDEDPSLSNAQKYLSTVDVKTGQKEHYSSGPPTQPLQQENMAPQQNANYANISHQRISPPSDLHFSSPPPQKSQSRLAESKHAAFKKSVPRKKIQTSKWDERSASIPASWSTREVPARKVILPKSNAKEIALNFEKLRRLLLTHGEFPEKYRTIVWRFVLSLPENSDVFSNLLVKGPHMSTQDLHKRFPIANGRLFRRLEKILSALAHYSPVFACSDSIPELIYPFLKVYGSDFVSIFETVVTFYRNWGKDWLEVVPNAPASVLDMVQHILEENDPKLLDHLKECRISSKEYAWIPLKSLFSHNFTKKQWVKLMDHVLTMPPIFLYYFTVAYLSYFRQTLFSMTSEKDFEFFFEHESPCDINKIIQKAYNLISKSELHFPKYESFEKLPASYYPIMSQYPKHTVNQQLNNRERILREEKKLLQRKQRFAGEEAARLQVREHPMSQMRRNEALRQAEEQLQQDLREREEAFSRRREQIINNRIKTKHRSDLVESDQAEFNAMNGELHNLRSSQSDMMQQIERANAEIAQLKYEKMLSDLNREKAEILAALNQQGEENSRMKEALQDKQRQIDALASAQPSLPREEEPPQPAVPERTAEDKEERPIEETVQVPDQSAPQEEAQPREYSQPLNSEESEQRALRKQPTKRSRTPQRESEDDRPSDPVSRQLESGILSPPPRPLGKAPIPQEQTSSARRQLNVERPKKRPSSSRTTRPDSKNKKVVIPKPAHSATPSSLSEETPVSPAFSPATLQKNRKPVSRGAKQKKVSKPKSKNTKTQRQPLSTPQTSTAKPKLSEEQNRYIREKFMDFIHSRTTITGESPAKSKQIVSSSGTDYPWMEALSDSISISDSYSLGDTSRDEDSILRALEERRHRGDALSFLHDEETTEDLSYMDEDEDMITTLPSTTLNDITVPSGVRTDASLLTTTTTTTTTESHRTSDPATTTTTTSPGYDNHRMISSSTPSTSALITTSSESTPQFFGEEKNALLGSRKDRYAYSSTSSTDDDDTSSLSTSTSSNTTTTRQTKTGPAETKWITSTSSSSYTSSTSTPADTEPSTSQSNTPTKRTRHLYSSPSISFTSMPRESDYLDSDSDSGTSKSDKAVPLEFYREDTLSESVATTDILQTSTSS